MFRMMILAMALMVAATASADTAKISNAVDLWNPLTIDEAKGTTKITFDQQNITPQIFEAVIISGLCAKQGSDTALLENVNEVAILNRHGGQGFIYETGGATCSELISVPMATARLLLLGATRGY